MTLAVWSQVVTWSLSVVWFLLIGRCWWQARVHAQRIKRHTQILQQSVVRPSQPDAFLDPEQYLQAEGWKASSRFSQFDMIAYWRAVAKTDRLRLSGYVEMMPQIGLLGTVVSLFLSAFLFAFEMTTLGFALGTTILGLTGSLWARATLELPADAHYFTLLELLQDKEVVKSLLHAETSPQPSSQGDESQPQEKSGVSFLEGQTEDARSPR